MFGYVRPLKAAMSEEDAARYQAVYCGLCRRIGRRYGRIAQMFLNYDFAFLAMVLSPEEEAPCISCRRCPVYVSRKRDSWEGGEGLETAAAESVVLTYWKLRDNIADSGFCRSLLIRMASWLLRPAYRKARRHCPTFDETVCRCLDELRQLEEEGCPSLDRPADAFARILQAASGKEGVAGQAALGQLLYHVGRWIYLIDAWDDLEEDRKNQNYNPILLQFGEDVASGRASLQETMDASLGLASSAYEWMEIGAWAPIIENILTLGLPAMEEVVLTGQWRERKKRIIRRAGDE